MAKLIRIATWNVQGGYNDDILPNLNKHSIDVVAFQEVDCIKSLYWKLVHEGPFCDCVEVPNNIQGEEPTNRNAIAIFSKYPIYQNAVTLLGVETGSGIDQWERHLLWAEIHLDSTHRFNFFAGHFGLSNKLDMMNNCVDFITQHFASDKSILVGDLNLTPDRYEIKQLIDNGFKDVWNIKNPTDNGYTWKLSSDSSELVKRIDYHFINSTITPENIRSANKFGSYPIADHYGVAAEYSIESEASFLQLEFKRFKQLKTKRRLEGTYIRKPSTPQGKVYTHDPNDGSCQQWAKIPARGYDNQFFIKHRFTGLYLDGRSTQSGDKQDVYLYWPNLDENQRWRFNNIGENRYHIEHVASGKYLDANSGGEVYTLSNNGGEYQVWTEEP